MKRRIQTLAVPVLALASALVIWIGLTVDEPDGQSMSAEHPYLLLTDTLEHIYLAFSNDTEEAIYDALAQVTDGDVLTDLYLQKRQTLVNRNFSDETTRIHGVDLIEMTLERSGDSLHFDARWHVLGSVGHEEHQHIRGNTYEAGIIMEPVDGTLKVTAFELRDMVRNDGEPEND